MQHRRRRVAMRNVMKFEALVCAALVALTTTLVANLIHLGSTVAVVA